MEMEFNAQIIIGIFFFYFDGRQKSDLTVVELFLCTNHSYVQPSRGALTNTRYLLR